jgi:plastocyanin
VKRLAALLVAGLMLGLLAGCANEETAAEPVETNEVDLPRSYLFDPEAITVKAGTEVTWTNSDEFTHSVKLESPVEEMVGVIKPGEETSFRFEEPGRYEYVCTFHLQQMDGTVEVVA